MLSGLKAGDAFTVEFVTVDSAILVAESPDIAPAAKLMRNGAIDNAVTVTVTEVEEGLYKATGTIPGGYVDGTDDLAVVLYLDTADGMCKDIVRVGRLAGHARANVTQWLGTAVATPATAGVPSVDAVAISGDSMAADIMEGFATDYGNLNLQTDIAGTINGNVTGNIEGNVNGKVLGGGYDTITGTGARVVDASGNNVATATALQIVDDTLDGIASGGTVVRADNRDGDAITAGIGGDATVYVYPLAAVQATDAISHHQLTVNQYAAKSWTIPVTDSAGTAVNLGGKTIKVAAFMESAPATILWSMAGAVGGGSSNLVTFSIADTDSATARVVKYIARNTTDDTDIFEGTITIEPAPNIV
jgi:hypothetical protein